MTWAEALATLRRDHVVQIGANSGTWTCSCGKGTRSGAGTMWNKGNRAQQASDRHLRSALNKILSAEHQNGGGER